MESRRLICCYDLPRAPPASCQEKYLRTDRCAQSSPAERCVNQLVALEQRGFIGDRLLAIFQNQWRGDDEVPFVPISEFVAAWNRLKLQPELRLVTASESMATLEKEIGSRIPEYQGVWPDWWSNGPAAAPRELAASRLAKRYLRGAACMFGPVDANAKATTNDILADLALFGEHTFAAAYGEVLPVASIPRGSSTRRRCWRCVQCQGAQALFPTRANESIPSREDSTSSIPTCVHQRLGERTRDVARQLSRNQRATKIGREHSPSSRRTHRPGRKHGPSRAA